MVGLVNSNSQPSCSFDRLLCSQIFPMDLWRKKNAHDADYRSLGITADGETAMKELSQDFMKWPSMQLSASGWSEQGP